MRDSIVLALLIASVIFFSFAVYNYNKSPGSTTLNVIKNDFNPGENNTNISLNSINNTSVNDTNKSKDDSANSGGSNNQESDQNSGGDDSQTNEPLPNETLPADINTSACGFYYTKYGVCAGNCKEGKCVSESNSCFCKLVK